MSELSQNKPRVNSIRYLIEVGLHYCCEAYFWRLYITMPAPLIAARLGVAVGSIRRRKMLYRRGLLSGPCHTNCLKGLL